MEPWTHNHVKLKTGHMYHYVDQKPDPAHATGNTMICLHGFPDQWFGWRNQIEPWSRAGYRVLVPSMLGYGGSVSRNPLMHGGGHIIDTGTPRNA
jgi:soluble epoxide hydrolase/lipid-phosphate phosphatase